MSELNVSVIAQFCEIIATVFETFWACAIVIC